MCIRSYRTQIPVVTYVRAIVMNFGLALMVALLHLLLVVSPTVELKP